MRVSLWRRLAGLPAALGRNLRLFGSVANVAFTGMARNRMRAALSTTGIAIGVATLIGIYSLTQGLTASFVSQIARLGANTFYVTSRPWVIQGDWWRYRNRPPVTMADARALLREGRLMTAVAPMGFAGGAVTYRNTRAENAEIVGTTEQYIDTSDVQVAQGRFVTALDVELDQAVVVLGPELKDVLFGEANPLNERIVVGHMAFTVIGVLVPRGKSFGRSLDNRIVIPIGRFQRLYGERRQLQVAVAGAPDKLAQVEEEAIEILRRHRGLRVEQDDNFNLNKQSEIARIFERQTASLYIVGYIIGAITLVVGAVGVMNIMLVAVTERTREIGVRRALGATRRTIVGQFLTEAVFVTLVGGVIGTAVGLGTAELVGLLTPLAGGKTSVAVVVLGIFISGLVGVVSGLWPAMRAASLDPIESLRYE